MNHVIYFVNMQLNEFSVIFLRNNLTNLNVLRCRHIYLGQQGAHYGLQRLLPRAVIETDSETDSRRATVWLLRHQLNATYLSSVRPPFANISARFQAFILLH